MRRSLRYSTAPHEPRRLGWLLEPAVYLANLSVAVWVYPAWRTARVRWHPDIAGLIHLIEKRSGPIICFGWHAYELLTFCAFRQFPPELIPTAIGHDGFLSRALQQFGTWYGFPVWAYRRRSSVRPKAQLIDLLAGGRDVIGLFPDSGGPDGEVRPGMVEVARAVQALLVPMAMDSHPVIGIPGPRQYWLPLPFSRVAVYYGEPLDGRHCTLAACQGALEELERRMNRRRNAA